MERYAGIAMLMRSINDVGVMRRNEIMTEMASMLQALENVDNPRRKLDLQGFVDMAERIPVLDVDPADVVNVYRGPVIPGKIHTLNNPPKSNVQKPFWQGHQKQSSASSYAASLASTTGIRAMSPVPTSGVDKPLPPIPRGKLVWIEARHSFKAAQRATKNDSTYMTKLWLDSRWAPIEMLGMNLSFSYDDKKYVARKIRRDGVTLLRDDEDELWSKITIM